jgi:hypothetical protein
MKVNIKLRSALASPAGLDQRKAIMRKSNVRKTSATSHFKSRNGLIFEVEILNTGVMSPVYMFKSIETEILLVYILYILQNRDCSVFWKSIDKNYNFPHYPFIKKSVSPVMPVEIF